MENIKVLKDLPLFSKLGSMELLQAAKTVRNRRLNKGTLMNNQGQSPIK